MKSKQIRLTSTSYAVLSLLDLLGEATPYDLKRALEQSIENFWHVPHTTIYSEPTRLAEGGLLSECQEAGGRRRKLYSLTDSGRRALREWAGSPESAPPELRDEGMLKIFAGADPHAIFTRRRAWHEAKLIELEGLLSEMRSGGGSIADELDWSAAQRASAEATLRFGIAYHQLLLAQVGRFLLELEAAARAGPTAKKGTRSGGAPG